MVAALLRQRAGETEQELLACPPTDSVMAPIRPLPIALWAHGAGGQEIQPLTNFPSSLMVPRSGFLLVSGDWAGTHNWGNDAAVAQISELIAELRATGYATNDPVITVCGSMGNVTTLNWAIQNPNDWRGHASFVGAWNLNAFYSEDRWDLAWSIDAAYGGSWAGFADKATHDPALYIDQLPARPLYIVYGSADDATIPSEAEAAIAAWNGPVTAEEIVGGTHVTASNLHNRGNFKQWLESIPDIGVNNPVTATVEASV